MEFKRYQKLAAMMFEPDGEGGVGERHEEINARAISPLILAYVGDAYFHLFVRTRLLSFEQGNIHVISEYGARIVSAVWQARAYKAIEGELTEEERAVFKRGRNAKSHAPRSATVAEYHASTGFEALLGTLYLEKKEERLREVAELAFKYISRTIMEEQNEKQGGLHGRNKKHG